MNAFLKIVEAGREVQQSSELLLQPGPEGLQQVWHGLVGYRQEVSWGLRPENESKNLCVILIFNIAATMFVTNHHPSGTEDLSYKSQAWSLLANKNQISH